LLLALYTNSILNHGKAHFENALKPAIFKISFSMFRIGIGINGKLWIIVDEHNFSETETATQIT